RYVTPRRKRVALRVGMRRTRRCPSICSTLFGPATKTSCPADAQCWANRRACTSAPPTTAGGTSASTNIFTTPPTEEHPEHEDKDQVLACHHTRCQSGRAI